MRTGSIPQADAISAPNEGGTERAAYWYKLKREHRNLAVAALDEAGMG